LPTLFKLNFYIFYMNSFHKGVGLIICNSAKTKFFIQQKDDLYPIEKWRNTFSFWGGAMEKSDISEKVALIREITEELFPPEMVLQKNWKYVDNYNITGDANFIFSLFELKVNDAELIEISKINVKEGKGKLMYLNEINTSTWIWNLEIAFHAYMKLK